MSLYAGTARSRWRSLLKSYGFPGQSHKPPPDLNIPYISTKGQTVVTTFDKFWKPLPAERKHQINEEYRPLNERDWRELTLDQKRACKQAFLLKNLNCTFHFCTLFVMACCAVYSIAYGSPYLKDPYEGAKVFAGVVATITAAAITYAIVRSFGN